jgi:hypothetical protein
MKTITKPMEVHGNIRGKSIQIKKTIRVKPMENPKQIHADEYTFYRDVRPVAVICKFLGIFSLQNVLQSDGRRLKHKFLSVDAFWGPIFIGALPIPFIEYGNDDFGRYWRIMQCLRGLITVSLSSYYDASLPEMISKMETLGVVLRSMSTKKTIQKNINRHGRIAGYVGVVGSVLFVSINTFVEFVIKRVPFLRLMVHLYGTLNLIPRQVYVVMYVFFCYNIILIFRDIQSCWKEHVNRISETDSDMTFSVEQQLENVRLVHVDLLRVVRLLNQAYGTKMAFYLATIFIEVLLDLYIFFFYNNYSYIQLEYYIFNAVTFYMLTSVTDELTHVVRILKILFLS